MEGAAIGYVCYALKTPYGIIRAISDDLDENKGVDYEKFCKLASKTVGAHVNISKMNNYDRLKTGNAFVSRFFFCNELSFSISIDNIITFG